MKVKVGTQVFQDFFNLDNRLVHLCVQVLKISLLLFSVAPSVLYKIKCFSFRHMRHFFVDGLNFVPLAFIFHFTSQFRPRSFKSQMYEARDEFVRFPVFDMSVLCSYNRSLNLLAVTQVYVSMFPLASSVVYVSMLLKISSRLGALVQAVVSSKT